MLGIFLSLFKTVDFSARHFHRRRKPNSCSPQQHQIRSDVWYSSTPKCSPELIGPAETTEVCSSRRRPSTKPLSSCIRRPTRSQSRFLWRLENRFVKQRARTSAPTFSTSTLTTPRGYLLLIDRCVGVTLFAVEGVPLDYSPEDLQEVGN